MIKYDQTDNSFQEDLRRRVTRYFTASKKLQTGNWRLYLKSAILFSSVFVCYRYIVFVPTASWITLVLCALLGALFSLIGFNIMHDASHGSYSKRKWINFAMGLSLEMMGNSSYLWKRKHNIIHHTYTNTAEDDDIDLPPFLRIRSDQPKRWFHKYQHYYAPALYAILYLYWVWYTDFKKYFTRKIGGHAIPPMRWWEHGIFWSSKLFHGTVMIAIPIEHFGEWALLGYAVFALTCGFIISIVFQLAHVVEGADFPTPDETGVIRSSWAVEQVRTTSNFAQKSVIAFWLFGGLNHQIEHHLFPKIAHVHYRKIAKIVRSACAEYGITYSSLPLGKAIASHFRMLKACGNN
jgi:linoleoyl-CoA desaturase